MTQLTHGSLFSGIGGFDLAAEWMGWKNIFHCELNEFGQKILKHHFPNADSYSDITQTDFTKYEGSVSIISGGFPCQPFSQAGKRKGTDDERYLWNSMLRAVREVKPKYVIAENVYGLVNIDSGLVLKQVQSDLENEGFEVQCFVIGACSKNAPHQRQRVWIVAYSKNVGCKANEKIRRERGESEHENRSEIWSSLNSNGKCGNAPDTKSERTGELRNESKEERSQSGHDISGKQHRFSDASNTNQIRLQGSESAQQHDSKRWQEQRGQTSEYLGTNGSSLPFEKFPTEPPVCGGDDGIPSQLDNITIPKWRNESIMAYGNAIVPNVAHELFQVIQQLENLDK
tara:strand:- start:297 stop:1325 length:1029 start_codon:yes stop_codon:yes gene_type:complete